MPLPRQQDGRHRVDGQVTVPLLEHGPDVDHRVGSAPAGVNRVIGDASDSRNSHSSVTWDLFRSAKT